MIDWSADRAGVDRALAEACDRAATRFPPKLFDAVQYSLVGGGKRFRGLLLLSSYRAAGGRADASKLAAAVEMLSTYLKLRPNDAAARELRDRIAAQETK